MEFSALASQRPANLPDSPITSAAARPARAEAVRPETPRPVASADPPVLPSPIKGLGIPPLDLAQVGDNDDVPMPPDPPRDPISQLPGPEVAQPDAAPPEDEAPVFPVPGAELPQLLDDLSEGPSNPTVDLRR